jgi:hypothetical protein
MDEFETGSGEWNEFDLPNDSNPVDEHERARERRSTFQDSFRPLTRLYFDPDIVKKYGFTGARIVKYFECVLAGKVRRYPGRRQYTYDPVHVIADRIGVSESSFNRKVKKMEEVGLIVTGRTSRKNMLKYGFADQEAFFKSRSKIKPFRCSKAEADMYGETAAIMLENLRYWHRQNKDVWRLFGGRFWRYTSLAELCTTYKFLSYDQVQRAVKTLRDEDLVITLEYYDQNGTYREDLFWITLKSIAQVADIAPKNHVLWDGLILRDGTKITSQFDRKTAAENEQTASHFDQTEQSENSSQSIQPQSTGEKIPGCTYKEASLSDSPLAGARSKSCEDGLKANHPKPLGDRPAASRSPSATSSPAASESAGAFVETQWGNVTCPGHLQKDGSPDAGHPVWKQQAGTSQGCTCNPCCVPSDADWKEHAFQDQNVFLVLRTIKPAYPKFIRQEIKNETELALRELGKAGQTLPEPQYSSRLKEITAAKKNQMLDCFGAKHDAKSDTCQSCPWKTSCSELFRYNHQKLPDRNAGRFAIEDEIASDNENQVRDNYRQTYKEVFGVAPDHGIGEAKRILENAHQTGLSVRLFCLVYMNLWARSHPKLTFRQNLLLGDAAVRAVRMICEVSRHEYASVYEGGLALILKKPLNPKIDWRYKPGRLDRIMDFWGKAWEKKNGSQYTFTVQDSRFMMISKDVEEGMADDFAKRLVRTLTAKKQKDDPGEPAAESLAQAVRRVCGLPEPTPHPEDGFWEFCESLRSAPDEHQHPEDTWYEDPMPSLTKTFDETNATAQQTTIPGGRRPPKRRRRPTWWWNL